MIQKGNFHIDHVADRSIDWLENHHSEKMHHVTNAGFLSFTEAMDEEEAEIVLEKLEELEFFFKEWILADAVYINNDSEIHLTDILLSEKGPKYSAEDRKILEALRDNPLRIYEVTETDPQNHILHLKDITVKGEKNPVIQVYDKKASASSEKGNIFGLRVIEWQGKNILSGAGYLFDDFYLNEFHSELKDLLKRIKSESDRIRRFKVTTLIIKNWAFYVLSRFQSASQGPMKIIDAKSGDPVVFTTDLYEIIDAAELKKFINKRKDIELSAENEWVWYTEAYEDGPRIRGTLTINGKGRLKIESNTIQKADWIREEFEKSLMNAVKFKTRKLEDIASEKLRNEYQSREKTEKSKIDMKDPEFVKAIQGYFLNLYKNWADEPLPLFGHKTPREMLSVKGGEKKVRGLIALYENGNRASAAEGDIPSVSFDFLYEQLGIKK
jgi:hypothetical protein